MPPYVKETQDSVMQFVQQLHIPVLNTLDDLNLFLKNYIKHLEIILPKQPSTQPYSTGGQEKK